MSYEFFCFFYTGKGYFADVGYLLTEGTDFDVLTLDATKYLVEDARYHVDFSVFEQRAITAIAHAGSFYTLKECDFHGEVQKQTGFRKEPSLYLIVKNKKGQS